MITAIAPPVGSEFNRIAAQSVGTWPGYPLENLCTNLPQPFLSNAPFLFMGHLSGVVSVGCAVSVLER